MKLRPLTTLSGMPWCWRGIARALLLAGALVMLLPGLALLASPAAEAQIAFRNAASASARQPSFRAAAASNSSIAHVANGAQVVGTGASITPVIPAGTQANDFAVLIVAGRPTDLTDAAAPTGWTLRSSVVREVGANDLKLMTFYRVLTGGDANPVVALPASWQGAAAGMSGQIIVWAGVDTTTPFDVADVTNTSAAAAVWTPPSITPVTNGTRVVSAVATSDDNDVQASDLQGFTTRMQGTSYNTTTGGDHSIAVADKVVSAAAATMLQWGQNTNGNDPWVGITFALRPVATQLTISKPAGTIENDVMIAAVAVQPSSATITAPAGWTLVRRIDNGSATTNSLAVYSKVAGASEPAYYAWTVASATFSVGGIQSFYDVATTTPVDVENGQATASAQTHATPSVTTTVVNAMLVTSHTFASSRNWSPPGGMTEGFDQPSGSDSAAGQSIEGNYVLQAAAGATGAKTATADGDDDRGNTHILALRPATPALTINKPTGTVANDVMIAAVGVQSSSATITAPSGWTLVRRMDNGSATTNSLAIYRKVAGGAEPASYTWTLGGFTHAAGGIQSFSGVDNTTPIDVENGQTTASGTSHATPSVTTTVAATMLVTSHTFASSRTWTPPAAMNEAFDVASLTVSNASGQSMEGNYVAQAAIGATGAKTATVGGNADVGNAHILALRTAVAVPTPGSFNAFETSTAALAITGVIKTRIAGSAFSLDVVAIASGAQQAGFTDAVIVELLGNNTLGVSLDAQYCPTSSTLVQTVSPNPTITGGRSTVNFAAVANSWRDVRVRVRWPTLLPTVTWCSTDNFAIRPNTLASFAVTDTDWQTAGTGRALTEVTFGTVTHKAGRPFSVRATAVNAAGTPATTTNYVGTPAATISVCGSAACTATFGALTLGTTFVAGQLTSDVASYNNVGSFSLQLVDSDFASVDNADSTALEREITSGAAINVGRFVPDHFAVAVNTPVFAPACGPFTYIGQAFNYTTAPVITLTAQDFANNTTTLYNSIGNWFRITSASLTGKSYTAAIGTLDVSGLPGTDPVIVSSGLGVGTLTFGSGTGLFFTRTTPTAPASPYDADISLAINVIDDDGVTLATNPARFGTATAGNGIAFSDGSALTTNDKQLRFGRLAIRNANGSQLVPLAVPMETQYWNGTVFVTNVNDNCTTVASGNVGLGNYSGALASGDTTPSVSGAFSAGRKTLMLSAPGAAKSGSVDVVVNLNVTAGAINPCVAFGAPAPTPSAANLAHLRGMWCGASFDRDPVARARFGVSRGAEEVIFIRENF